MTLSWEKTGGREGGDGSGDGDTSHGKDSDVRHIDYFELKTFEKQQVKEGL